MARNYKIAYFKSDNEWVIMREDGDNVQWLSSNDVWTVHKQWAKRFFHEDTATSALIISKRKCIEEEKPYRPEGVANSWRKLSSQ